MLRATSGVTRGQIAAAQTTGYQAGTYRVMFDGAVGGTTTIPAADTLCLYPYPIFEAVVVSEILAHLMVVGAGSSMKCAVWANNRATGRPTGVPILGQNAGFTTSASTGNKSAAIADVAVAPGMYWFGSKATGTMPAMLHISGNGNAAAAARLSSSTATDILRNNGVQPIGVSAPDAYANDIMATDLSAATFTMVFTGGIPVLALGFG